MLREFAGVLPRLGRDVFVDPSAQVIGDVALGDQASVWMQAVVRGDVNTIRIGARSNLQDLCVAHVTLREFPLVVGEGVTVGHQAVVHGCTIGDRVLVGIGARVLDGAVVDSDCIVGAGALVPPGMRVASGQLVVGLPARVVRPLSDGERDHIRELAQRYVELAARYRSGFLPSP
jgi:carbonic anhydrase/acetyltransferase-like protein (isoleucine patch superfamily)